MAVDREVNYSIEIKTGTEWWAGTDADVYMTIYGSLRNTTSMKLSPKASNPFENGATDYAVIRTLNVGESSWIPCIMISDMHHGSYILHVTPFQ